MPLGGQKPEEEAGVLDFPESSWFPTGLPNRAAQASGTESGSGAAARATPMVFLSSFELLSATATPPADLPTPRVSAPCYNAGPGSPTRTVTAARMRAATGCPRAAAFEKATKPQAAMSSHPSGESAQMGRIERSNFFAPG